MLRVLLRNYDEKQHATRSFNETCGDEKVAPSLYWYKLSNVNDDSEVAPGARDYTLINVVDVENAFDDDLLTDRFLL